jgi:hypothetical protein
MVVGILRIVANRRNHFARMTVSLGDHNVNNTHSETKNVLRKMTRIIRYRGNSTMDAS